MQCYSWYLKDEMQTCTNTLTKKIFLKREGKRKSEKENTQYMKKLGG